MGIRSGNRDRSRHWRISASRHGSQIILHGMKEDKYDIENIQAQRDALLSQMDESGQCIRRYWEALTAKPESAGKTQQVLYQIEKGLAIYDGVMTGYKLYKRLKGVGIFFSKGKKRK